MSVDTNVEEPANQPPRTSNRWFWIATIGVVLVLGIGWIAYSRALVNDSTDNNSQTSELQPAAVAGHPAPDFELTSPDGEVYKLSDFKGQPVILNFWATWCGPCRAEFPEFQEAAVDNADSLVIIGINNTTADQADQVPDFLEEFGITFPIVLDETGKTVKSYRIIGLPTTVFVDSNGIVNEVFTGPLNKAYIETKISELEAGL